MSKKVAIIDLGSNSVRMLIMRLYRDGSYKMIDQAKEMVRLGENMGKDMTLKAPAIRRTINTLGLFSKIIEAHNVEEIAAVATAAVRNAENQKDFLRMVSVETGFDFEVISGEEEAYFDYLAVINTISAENCVIIDIGGASTEIIWVENRKVKEVISLPFGAVSLTEKFLSQGNFTSSQMKELKQFLVNKLKKIEWLTRLAGLPVIGLGGSIRTFAKIDKRIKDFPLEGLHNYQLTFAEIVNIDNMISTSNLEERIGIPGLDKDRADIIPAGSAVIRTIMELISSRTLIVSGNGLREGIFFKYFLSSEDHQDGIVLDTLSHSIDNILKNYEMNLKHCYHVRKLALSLFDQTKDLHGMDKQERKILSVGALLHDIGVYVNYYNHRKHGFYLVLNSRLNGLDNKELLMCAYIVGQHTNEDSKKSWRLFNILLDKLDYKKIRKLSLFVKIAEQLDRNEYGTVDAVQCEILPDQVNINLLTPNSAELEITEALKCSGQFEKLLQRKMCIIPINYKPL